MIDIVVTTCNRVELLKNTIAYIIQRTAPKSYNLIVSDDASTDGTQEYLKDSGLQFVTLKERVGIPAQLRNMLTITRSDPIVFTDDDILCPKVNPDWLARGLKVLQVHTEIGILALNLPQCNIDNKRHLIQAGLEFSLCKNIGGSFVFIRRKVLRKYAPLDGTISPVKAMCYNARKMGWQVGYLTNVYCQHTGAISIRNSFDLSDELEKVFPVNGDTLEPPERYKG